MKKIIKSPSPQPAPLEGWGEGDSVKMKFISLLQFQVIFGLIFLLAFFSPKFLEASPKKKSITQAETKIYTVIEFESTFMNRRKKEILKTLGEPDRKSQVQEKEVWKYNQIVKDMEQVWDQNIMFDFGRVNYIWSDQPTAGKK